MRRFVSDATWNLGATFIDKFCNLLAQAYLVRKLGIDSYGAYAAICALGQVTTTSLVWRGGEVSIQALETSRADQADERRQTLAFLVAYDIRVLGIGGLVLAPLLWLSAPLFNVDRIAWLLAGLCFANIGHAAIRGVQTVENRFAHMAIHSILSTVLMTLAIILLAARWGMQGAIYGLLAGNFIKTWIGIGIERVIARSPWPSISSIANEIFHPSYANRVIGSGRSSFTRGILQQVLSNGDTLAISMVATPATVGLYKVARAGASVPGALISPVISVLRGRIVAAWGRVDLPRLRELMRHTLLFSLCGAFLGALCAPVAAIIIAPQVAGRELALASAILGAGFVLNQGLNTIHLIFAILSRDDRTSIIIQLLMSFILLGMVMITGNLGMIPLSSAATFAYITGAIIFVRYGYQTIRTLKGKTDS